VATDHPGRVRTLVAFEPPVAELLPTPSADRHRLAKVGSAL
jgi:hypothetical protein